MKRNKTANFARKGALKYLQQKVKEGDYLAMTVLNNRSNSTLTGKLTKGKSGYHNFYRDLNTKSLNEMVADDQLKKGEIPRYKRYNELLKGQISNPKRKIKPRDDGFSNAKPLPKTVTDANKKTIDLTFGNKPKNVRTRRIIYGLSGVGVLGAGYTTHKYYKNRQSKKKPSFFSR